MIGPDVLWIICRHLLAPCDGGGRGRPGSPEQLQAPGGRVPTPAGHHAHPAVQQLQAPTESQTGVEALPQSGTQVGLE